jgi:hypothetical protein
MSLTMSDSGLMGSAPVPRRRTASVSSDYDNMFDDWKRERAVERRLARQKVEDPEKVRIPLALPRDWCCALRW